MLIHQMLMALFLGIGNLGVPSPFLHDFPGPENGILKMVMTVDVGWIFNQVGLSIFRHRSPSRIRGMFQVVWLMARATSWHSSTDLGMTASFQTQKRRPVLGTGSPWMVGKWDCRVKEKKILRRYRIKKCN
jgi:hypothetical protein